MSVHDYFKPLAPKHSKKSIWDLFPIAKSNLPELRLPKILQKNYQVKNSVSIISFPAVICPKVPKRSEASVKKPLNSKVLKVTTKLLKRSGIKVSVPIKSTSSREKSNQLLDFNEINIKSSRIVPVNCGKNEKTEENEKSGEKSDEEKFREFKNSCQSAASGNYFKLELNRVNTLPDEKKVNSTALNSKRRYTCIKECLSLPSINNDEFELKGW